MTKTTSQTAQGEDPNTLFDDFDKMTELVIRSMRSAAKKAVAENDALGIDSVGAVNGKIVWRKAKQKPPSP